MTRLTRSAAARLAAALMLTAATAALPSAAPVALAQQVATDPVQQQLIVAAQNVDTALAALQVGDVTTARLSYGAWDDAWDAMEDGIRDPHPDVYETIEAAMDNVEDVLLKVDTPSPATAATALTTLRQAIDTQSARLG